MRNNPPLSSDPASSSRGGTSKTPSTPTSSSLETPVIPKTRHYMLNFMQTPESPMFSQADKEKIHKQKGELHVEIAALTQHRNQLRLELNKIKASIVSQGELTFLKAETRGQISSSNSSHLKELMNVFVDTIRDISASRATCSILEQKIKEESQRRTQIVEESQSVAGSLDFSDLSIFFPKLPQHECRPISKNEDQEIRRLLQKLQDIRKDTINCEGVIKASNPKHKETALEIARSAESQWQLKSVGTISLRNEIQRLQRAVATSDSQIRKLESAVESEHQKVAEAQMKQQKEESEALSNLNHGKEEFAKTMDIIEEEINQLNIRIKSSSQIYDNLMEELHQLDNQKKIIHTNLQNDNDDKNNDNDDDDKIFDFDEAPQSQNAIDLQNKKQELQKEIENLKHQVNRQKKKAKIKETKMMSDIKKLQVRYKTCRATIQKSCVQISELDSGSVTGEIKSLIQKIDTSITDLQSVINNQ
ncbi:hypothetical protein TRFO_17365 [Tritrichomonas foetus]|uniref:Uncharacterized protein n=1 Tax=Tritrichomonas foetus TaxID=1144522 RepID=A0A1J4KN35_9EUKA|nr:hypothetical protein TRFO_17365 [Tritrichomonas foetus]|eukprot:OHT12735.1 hypothetical protein TRFO_17365 [Tritrichomonas foetus]